MKLKTLLSVTMLFCNVGLMGAGFGGSLIKEYTVKAENEFGKDVFAKEERIAEKSPSFAKAISLEKENIEKMGKGRPNLSFYERVLPLLCKSAKESGSALPAYIAVEISQHLWLMKNSKMNNLCIVDTAKSLYSKRYCEGYLYYGQLLGQDRKYKEAIVVLAEGEKNCKKPYSLQRIKRKLSLYKYYNQKGSKK